MRKLITILMVLLISNISFASDNNFRSAGMITYIDLPLNRIDIDGEKLFISTDIVVNNKEINELQVGHVAIAIGLNENGIKRIAYIDYAIVDEESRLASIEFYNEQKKNRW